jgi:hypothetical protein
VTTIPNNPLVVLGPEHRYPVPLRVKLLRHFHDKVVGHIFVHSALLEAFQCHCQVIWMPDVERDPDRPDPDWVRWPTKLDHFEPYYAG